MQGSVWLLPLHFPAPFLTQVMHSRLQFLPVISLLHSTLSQYYKTHVDYRLPDTFQFVKKKRSNKHSTHIIHLVWKFLLNSVTRAIFFIRCQIWQIVCVNPGGAILFSWCCDEIGLWYLLVNKSRVYIIFDNESRLCSILRNAKLLRIDTFTSCRSVCLKNMGKRYVCFTGIPTALRHLSSNSKHSLFALHYMVLWKKQATPYFLISLSLSLPPSLCPSISLYLCIFVRGTNELYIYV